MFSKKDYGETALVEARKAIEKTKFASAGPNLFKGIYTTGTFSGPEGATDGRLTNNAGRLAIVEVEPNTTYCIDKTSSNRFRIGLTSVPPTVNTMNIYIIKGEAYDNKNRLYIKTRAKDRYLIAYVGLGDVTPSRLTIEKVVSVDKAWEALNFFGAVGNADFIKEDGTVWADIDFTIPATDDTEAIQNALAYGGVVDFPIGKNFLVTNTIKLDLGSIRKINGNGSTLIAQGDFLILDVKGNLSGSAAPESAGSAALREHGPQIDALRVRSSSGVTCDAISLNKTFGLILSNCNFQFTRNGIVFSGANRNVILNGSHVYGCFENGLYFKPNGDLHQINIIGTHVSYCRRNIFVDDHGIYNMQIAGCDIETSAYPAGALHDMHFRMNTKILEDIEITGCTIEDHWLTNEMIKFEGLSQDKIFAITLTGNVIGNSLLNEVSLHNVKGFSATGNTFKMSSGLSFKLSGRNEGINIGANIFASAGIIEATGDMVACNISGGAATGGFFNPIRIRANMYASSINNLTINMKATGAALLNYLVDIQPPNDIVATSVHDITVAAPTYANNGMRVELGPGQSQKVVIKDNIIHGLPAGKTAYTLPPASANNVIIRDNI